MTSTKQKTESYYNRKHGARWQYIDIGQSALVKDYHSNRVSWRQGKITRRVGNVICDVHVGSQTWVCHANQLKEAYSQPPQRSNMWPLNILIKHLDMNRGKAGTQVKNQLQEAPVYQQSRRTTRRRMSVTKIQVNIRQKTYITQLQRGDNRKASCKRNWTTQLPME
ncbi:hypothetical protein CLF_109324 [Clonorchis sinensis]|uniref:Uncharacterized protein n=1 Tax=Clonorchis sinensis TaxID=79923 RepID=G7YSH2_CLOSI|nr:hypothetical protein CLF_109324 [Clonorchis sinensis]